MPHSSNDQMVDKSKPQAEPMARKRSFEAYWARLLMWSLSLCFFIAALLLLNKCRYAWSETTLLELTTIQAAHFKEAGPGIGVRVSPDYAEQSRAFTRFLEPGAFRLVQDNQQKQLYYILRAPLTDRPFIAPRRLSGRLLTLSDAPLTDWALTNLVQQEAAAQINGPQPLAVIVEGELPQHLRWAFPASLFSGLLALLFAGLAHISFKPELTSNREKV